MKSPKVALIDFGGGNLRSVYHALTINGAQVNIVNSAAGLAQCDKVVFPGVGAFGPCMRALQNNDLIEALRQTLMNKPYLGLCLGLHVLYSSSDEDSSIEGLDIFPGHIAKLTPHGDLKLPHIGWSKVKIVNPECILFDNIPPDSYFYYVHSYGLTDHIASNLQQLMGTSKHSFTFSAVIQYENIVATQFHPEKSSDLGVQMYKSFIDWKI